jgi:hypothetical protein
MSRWSMNYAPSWRSRHWADRNGPVNGTWAAANFFRAIA